MQILGTDIYVVRGESFSIDYSLVNRDGSPYIVTNRANNAYFLLTVASTKYSQQGRYVKNWWLEIPAELRFENTNALEINKSMVDEKINPYSSSPTYAVYYYIDDDGSKVYVRWNGSEFVHYELRIVKTFSKQDTSEWTAQSYVYSINYVDGVLMLQYLRDLCDKHSISFTMTDTTATLLSKLIAFDDKYSNIECERALGKIDIALPIVSTSKIFVVDPIEGGII